MNDKTIKQYLAAFYDGTATEQEEQALADFFADKVNVPSLWKEEREVFLLIRKSAHTPLPEGLSKRLEKSLDTHISKGKTFRIKPIAYKITGIAAAVLLCIGIALNQASFNNDRNMTADTYQDPHEAAKVAGEALAFLSSNLNKGIDQMEDAQKEMQQVSNILNNQLK